MLMMAMGTVSLTISVSGFPASASACHPLSNSGHCYRAGQVCRYADAGKRELLPMDQGLYAEITMDFVGNHTDWCSHNF